MVRNIVTEPDANGNSPMVLFFSLEMARIELAECLLCCQSRVETHKVRKGHLNSDDIMKLMEAGDILRKGRLYTDDTPSRTMIQIAASARRLHKKHEEDGGLKLIVIDYLQLIEPENRRDPRQEQVAQISRRLKFLARDLLIPVIALAQVNWASEGVRVRCGDGFGLPLSRHALPAMDVPARVSPPAGLRARTQ